MNIVNDLINRIRFLWIPRARRGDAAAVPRRRTALRSELRAHPAWADGHLELGLNELYGIIGSGEKPSPRSLSTVRICADAVLLLMNKRSAHRIWNAKRVFEARVLLAMVYFLSRRYTEAYSEFSGILAFNNRALLRSDLRLLALEYGGLTAYLLERYDEAHEYLSVLPPGKLSAEALEALGRSSGSVHKG